MGHNTIPVKPGGKRILFTGGSGKAGRQYVPFPDRRFSLLDVWRDFLYTFLSSYFLFES